MQNITEREMRRTTGGVAWFAIWGGAFLIGVGLGMREGSGDRFEMCKP